MRTEVKLGPGKILGLKIFLYKYMGQSRFYYGPLLRHLSYILNLTVKLLHVKVQLMLTLWLESSPDPEMAPLSPAMALAVTVSPVVTLAKVIDTGL